MVPGILVGQALDQKWDTADLLVLTSRIETYGLVVVEALARGIPAVVSAGTGAVEALQEGGPQTVPRHPARPSRLATRRAWRWCCAGGSPNRCCGTHGGRRRSLGEIRCPDGSRRQRRCWHT